MYSKRRSNDQPSGGELAIAKLLHEQGVRVAICDIDSAALYKASLDLGGCIAEKADVSDNSAGLQVATPDEAREILGLKGGDQISF